MKTIITLFLILPGLYVFAQEVSFSNSYNYNDFSPALAVNEHEGDIFFSGVTYDSTNNTLSKYLACTDSLGTLKYWKTVSDTQYAYWAGYRGGGLRKVDEGGFIDVGTIGFKSDSSNGLLYRYCNAGDTLWTKQYTNNIIGNQVILWDCNTTNDNGFVATGVYSIAPYHSGVLLIEVDSAGQEILRKEYQQAGWIQHGYSVEQTSGNGYLLGMYQYMPGYDTSGDPAILKLDSLGFIQWKKNIGGPVRDFNAKVCLANDGNYIAGTSISDSTALDDYYTRIKIVKLSTAGEIIWENTYCGTELNNKLYAIYPDHNGGYVATGKRRNELHPGSWWNEYGWLIKINENGDSIWYREYQYYNGTGDDFNSLYDLCLTSDGGYAMVGQVSTWIEPQTAWLIKVDSLGQLVSSFEIPFPTKYFTERLHIYPNPATQYVNIRYPISNSRYSIIIYDLFGHKQDEIEVPKGQQETWISISNYAPGIYVAVLKNDQGILVRGKFVKR